MAAHDGAAAAAAAAASLAGASKSQLFEVMSEMKLLVDKDRQKARQVLVDNPDLTKVLFQAQIMLGMVKAPEVTSNTPQTLPETQPANVGQWANVPNTQSLPLQVGQQVRSSSSSQPHVPARQQQQIQTSISSLPISGPSMIYQSQPMPMNPPHPGQQSKEHTNAHISPPVSLPQSSQLHTSSQIHNVTLPAPPTQQYSIPQSHIPMPSSQAQQSFQTLGALPQPLQPPLPQQPRFPTLQPFPHHLHTQMPQSLGFQQQGFPQPFPSQHIFHPGGDPPSSFPHVQPPLPSQPPPQHIYQGGSHLGSDYNHQAGTSMQAERGAPWLPGLMDKPASQLPGPPQLFPWQMPSGPTGQQPHPPPLTPDMEKALLQQVLSLTPEQINLLPPEQQSQELGSESSSWSNLAKQKHIGLLG